MFGLKIGISNIFFITKVMKPNAYADRIFNLLNLPNI